MVGLDRGQNLVNVQPVVVLESKQELVNVTIQHLLMEEQVVNILEVIKKLNHVKLRNVQVKNIHLTFVQTQELQFFEWNYENRTKPDISD